VSFVTTKSDIFQTSLLKAPKDLRSSFVLFKRKAFKTFLHSTKHTKAHTGRSFFVSKKTEGNRGKIKQSFGPELRPLNLFKTTKSFFLLTFCTE
jgi:hypothetical protein